MKKVSKHLRFAIEILKLTGELKRKGFQIYYGSKEMPISFSYPNEFRDFAKEKEDKIRQIPRTLWQEL